MTGVRIVFGTLNTFVKRRMQENPRSTMMVFATNIPRKIVMKRDLVCLKEHRSGLERPWIVNAPIMMAARHHPEHRVSASGSWHHRLHRCLPPSEAATASGLPLPNCSGCLDMPRAVLYPTKDPISAPAPGMIPIMVPMRARNRSKHGIVFTSSFVGRSLVTLASISSVL